MLQHLSTTNVKFNNIYFKIQLTYLYSCDKLYEFSEMRQAGIAQSVVRRIGSAEVTGPIPVASFFIFCFV